MSDILNMMGILDDLLIVAVVSIVLTFSLPIYNLIRYRITRKATASFSIRQLFLTFFVIVNTGYVLVFYFHEQQALSMIGAPSLLIQILSLYDFRYTGYQFTWALTFWLIVGLFWSIRDKNITKLLTTVLSTIFLMFLTALISFLFGTIMSLGAISATGSETVKQLLTAMSIVQIHLIQSIIFAAILMIFLYIRLGLLANRTIKEARDQEAEKQRAEYNQQELSRARDVQHSLLPAGSLTTDHFNIFGSSLTADEVGGDYYDYFRLDDGRIIVVIGDVSGHGLSAGMVMGMAKAALHTIIPVDSTTESALNAVNRIIRLGTQENRRMFLTFCYVLLDPNEGMISCSVNGHPFPLLRRINGEVSEIEAIAYPLGIREEAQVSINKQKMDTGDRLLLYTDGITEMLNPDEKPWDYDQLQSHFEENGDQQPEEYVSNLFKTVKDHAQGRPQDDDMTAVCVEVM